MSSYYCTLDQAKNELKATGTVDDSKLQDYIRLASSRVDYIMNPRYKRQHFWPYLEQRAYEIDVDRIDTSRNTFLLDDNLLAFTEVLLDGTDVTSDIEAYPLLRRPIQNLMMRTTSRTWYDVQNSSQAPYYVKVDGTYGFNSDYANAWPVYDTLGANMNNSTTTITFTDIDQTDPFGFAPAFSVGTLLRVNDEIMLIVGDVDTTLNTATVRRAQQGTTATAHTSGDDVEVFQIEEPIRRAVTRQSALLYARRGAFQVETLDGVGVITYPQDLLIELREVLREYQYG